jgi:hypothetical protein
MRPCTRRVTEHQGKGDVLMAVVTVTRPDVSVEEVSQALRRGLGPKYKISPGTALNLGHLANPHSGQIDTILVTRRPGHLFRADLAISRKSDRTDLHVRAGGLTAPIKLANVLWVERKVRRVLCAAMSPR